MFMPFFTGNLIQRFGGKNIMLVGIGLDLLCILINTGTILPVLLVGLDPVRSRLEFHVHCGNNALTKPIYLKKKHWSRESTMCLYLSSSEWIAAGRILQNQIGWRL